MLYQNNSINLSNSAGQIPSKYVYCQRFQDEEFFMANYLVTLASIILSMLTCPVIILMNALVIVAVIKRGRLQNMYRILLAYLAGTDLLVGTVVQPTFVSGEILAIADGSATTFCSIVENVSLRLANLSILSSLFHLVLISVERYIALKYPFRHDGIVTKFRLAVAVTFSWCIAGIYTLLRTLAHNLLTKVALPFLVICSLLVIACSHIAVYLVTRRHEKQIETEQISQDAAAKFLEEKKAWKTTSIIIGFVFLSYLPTVLYILLFLSDFRNQTRFILRPLVLSSLMLNSLYNPIIYCWRSAGMRREMITLVKRQNPN